MMSADENRAYSLKVKFLSTLLNNIKKNASHSDIQKTAYSLVDAEPDNQVLKQSLLRPFLLEDMDSFTAPENKTLSVRRKAVLKREMKKEEKRKKFFLENYTDLMVMTRRHCENTHRLERRDFLMWEDDPLAVTKQDFIFR